MQQIIRLPFAFVLGLAFTASVFWLLWYFVNQPISIFGMQEAVRIEFTRLRQDTQAQSIREEKREREKPPETPELPDLSATSSSAPSDTVAMLTPTVDTRSAMSTMNISAGSDRDVIPLVRINPDYPSRALSRGIEGWVKVQFTITPSGTVADAKVLDADPKGMFDDAALKAIARWKYNPKVENGVAVERRGIQVVLRFDLED
jgi:periplasmic protein TonB